MAVYKLLVSCGTTCWHGVVCLSDGHERNGTWRCVRFLRAATPGRQPYTLICILHILNDIIHVLQSSWCATLLCGLCVDCFVHGMCMGWVVVVVVVDFDIVTACFSLYGFCRWTGHCLCLYLPLLPAHQPSYYFSHIPHLPR